MLHTVSSKTMISRVPNATYKVSSKSVHCLRRRFLKGFYHIWTWRPSWSCDQHHFDEFSFLCTPKLSYKIWLKMAQWLISRVPNATYKVSSKSVHWLRRRFLKDFYHIWTWRPSWSCDQHHFNKFSFLCTPKLSYKNWLKMAQWFLRKAIKFSF